MTQPPISDIDEIIASLTDQMQPFAGYMIGQMAADIMFIQGNSSGASQAGQAAFSSSVAQALQAALPVLGWHENDWCGVLLHPVGEALLRADQLRLIIEINDPLWLVALDEDALKLINAALADENEPASTDDGNVSIVMGRRLLFIDDFESSLGNNEAKQKAWTQLKLMQRS